MVEYRRAEVQGLLADIYLVQDIRMCYRPAQSEPRSEDLGEGPQMDDVVRSQRVHGRNMLPLIAEFAVRAVLDYQKIVFLGKRHQHLPLFQGQGFSRRILKIRNHIQELHLLFFRLDLGKDSFICFFKGLQIRIM